MCPHVLCLSLVAPPPTPLSLSLSPHKLALFTFFHFSLTHLSLFPTFCSSQFFVVGYIPRISSISIPLLLLLLLSFHQPRTMKARRRRCGSSSLKREFLKKWMKGLQICRSKKYATILERRNAIKVSADVAIASTRNAATRWSRALLGDVVSADCSNRTLVEQILGGRLLDSRSIACSRRILRRSRIARRRVVPKCVASSSSSSTAAIARKLVKSRTRALRKLVPGGEDMDGVSLLQETLDYIVSLRAQVNVMRQVAAAATAAR